MTNIIWYCLYVESKKKNDANELIYKTEIENILMKISLRHTARLKGSCISIFRGLFMLK